jgi:hypothetical protein
LSFRLAYALSWARAFPLAAAHLLVLRGEGWPAHYPALFGPAIAAVAVTAWTMGRPGIGDLLARVVPHNRYPATRHLGGQPPGQPDRAGVTPWALPDMA